MLASAVPIETVLPVADAAYLHMAAVSGAVGAAAVSAVSDADAFQAHGCCFQVCWRFCCFC